MDHISTFLSLFFSSHTSYVTAWTICQSEIRYLKLTIIMWLSLRVGVLLLFFIAYISQSHIHSLHFLVNIWTFLWASFPRGSCFDMISICVTVRPPSSFPSLWKSLPYLRYSMLCEWVTGCVSYLTLQLLKLLIYSYRKISIYILNVLNTIFVNYRLIYMNNNILYTLRLGICKCWKIKLSGKKKILVA